MGDLDRTGSASSRWPWAIGLCLVVQLSGCGGHDTEASRSLPEVDGAPDMAPATTPLVGTSYTHHSFAGCSWDEHGILDTWGRPGVAREVRRQLRRMRQSGLASLRLIVWHMRDVPRQHWGVVPSRGGRVPPPFRDHLVAYLREVRRLGFRRLTVSFSPQWANNPRDEAWAAGRLEENWAFIRDVRALTLEHGPVDVRFDLLNEGAPSNHAPAARRVRVMEYVGEVWRRYADAFGTGDATVSVIAPRTPHDGGRRLENLVDALGGEGARLPSWFELHLNYGPAGVSWGMHYVDSVLADRSLEQPITIGETSYDDAAVADAIGAFSSRSERPLEEVIQWYKRAGARCEVSPPYEADAYLRLGAAGLEDHPGPSVGGNSSAASVSAATTTSGLGSSAPAASGERGAFPELLMR